MKMANEVRLIDLNTLWECETCFHNGPCGCNTWCDAGEGYRPAASKFKIIDPESLRPRGRWEHPNGYAVTNGFVCSECGQEEISHRAINPRPGGACLADENGNFYYPPKMNYCPNCGAKMEG